jgi:hypothetical protein
MVNRSTLPSDSCNQDFSKTFLLGVAKNQS